MIEWLNIQKKISANFRKLLQERIVKIVKIDRNI